MTDENPDKPTSFEEGKWKEGQSGNPSGKPKGALNRRTLFKRYLDVIYRDPTGKTVSGPFGMADAEPLTVRELITVSMINEAIKGNVAAGREVFDTEFGTKPQVITQDPDSAPLHVKHEHAGKVEVELTGDALLAELTRRGLPIIKLEE